MRTQFDSYRYYSEAASRAERAGDCTQALQYWQKAEDNAPNAKQREWCRHRVQFLHLWATRIECQLAAEQQATAREKQADDNDR